MRVLICGDREWSDAEIMAREMLLLPDGTIVIEGECRGADRMAAGIARDLGFEVLPYPAHWDLYKKAAGPIRNAQMLKEGKPDLVLAFHKNFSASIGTKDMVTKALRAGVEVRVIDK